MADKTISAYTDAETAHRIESIAQREQRKKAHIVGTVLKFLWAYHDLRRYGDHSPARHGRCTCFRTVKATHQKSAGRAVFLITANFKDFITKNTAVMSPDRHVICHSPDGIIHIVHPYLMMEWLRSGKIPDSKR